MNAIVKHHRGYGAQLQQVPIPSIGDTDALIKVKATSICGTDVHIYTWDAWSQSRVHPPQILGHEFSGEVVKIGKNVTNVSIGDNVSAETHLICGKCPACLSGHFHVCVQTKIIGVDTNGCFAEYIALPAKNLWINTSTMPHHFASIQEPLGNAVHTVLAGEVVGKTIVIIGCGPIGLMAIGVAKVAGAAQIIAIDVNEYRLELAQKMGATMTINSNKEDPVKEVKSVTNGYGAEVVCEMSGHPVALNQGFEMIGNGGRMSILSLPSKKVEIDITNHIVFKGITVQGITGRKIFTTWQQVSQLIRHKELGIDKIITHTLPFHDFEEGFELMIKGQCGKVVLQL